jgi:hypothetical protein
VECDRSLSKNKWTIHWSDGRKISFVASQHLDSARDKFQLHDFRHICEEILDMGKQLSGAMSRLLVMPAGIPESIEDLPYMLPLVKEKHEASGADEADIA